MQDWAFFRALDDSVPEVTGAHETADVVDQLVLFKLICVITVLEIYFRSYLH